MEKLMQYVKEYEDHEGVQLDINKLEKRKNEGLYNIIKIILNSFWGKFGQRPNLKQIKFCREEKELWDLLIDQSVNIKSIDFLNDNLAQIEFNQNDEFVIPSSNTNIFIAIFTTAHARLKLYEALFNLGERVLYYDTDSVIYIHKDGLYEPEFGEYLGQYKDEVGGNDHITIFASGGPKNYGFITQNGKVEFKVRGFSLKPESKTMLNFDVMREMIKSNDFESKIPIDMGTTIKRNKLTWSLKTTPNSKDYRILYDKRLIVNGYETKPFGYCD